MKIHELKCWVPYYGDVLRGVKTFEIRKFDRDFKVGDLVHLREWNHKEENYTGDSLLARVKYLFQGGEFGVSTAYCVMGIDVCKVTP